jgi:hypothetical protein
MHQLKSRSSTLAVVASSLVATALTFTTPAFARNIGGSIPAQRPTSNVGNISGLAQKPLSIPNSSIHNAIRGSLASSSHTLKNPHPVVHQTTKSDLSPAPFLGGVIYLDLDDAKNDYHRRVKVWHALNGYKRKPKTSELYPRKPYFWSDPIKNP